MRRRVLIMVAVVALLLVAFAGPAVAGGKSDVAQTHPGHAGYVNSGGKNVAAPPVFHFAAHGGPGYDAGPGGWGAAVSATAKACGGLAKAHQGPC